MPTLPLEKDGQQRIMRDMWLVWGIEDSLLALAKDQRTAPLLLTMVCCRFRDRSTGPVGGCGASTGGWNSGRRQQERAPGRVPWLLAAGRWRRAQRGARAVRSRRRSALASRPADMVR